MIFLLGILELFNNQDKKETGLHVGEVYSLWTQLVAQYDILEITQFMLGYANDTDFKNLVQSGLNNVIIPQIRKPEETMEHYRIPLHHTFQKASPLIHKEGCL
jgi:hypothetical protein